MAFTLRRALPRAWGDIRLAVIHHNVRRHAVGILRAMPEANRYQKNFESLHPSHPYSLVREQLGSDVTVLDIGCGSGEVGEYLASSGALIDGVEVNIERAAVARRRLRTVNIGELGSDVSAEAGLESTYHVILFLDVLEHIVDPDLLMNWACQHLAPQGRIYAKIPNSAHLSARFKILKGDWSYADSGLFDRDHVRFYDLNTIAEFPRRWGLTETKRWYSGPFPGWLRGRQRLLYTFPRVLADAVLVEWRLGMNPKRG